MDHAFDLTSTMLSKRKPWFFSLGSRGFRAFRVFGANTVQMNSSRWSFKALPKISWANWEAVSISKGMKVVKVGTNQNPCCT